MKSLVPVEDVFATWQLGALGGGGQPCPQLLHGCLHIITVGVDVLSSDVGDENLIAVGICIENQRDFVTLTAVSVSLATQKQSKLQWHVEARKLMLAVELDRRYIMHSVPALFDDALNLREPELPTIIFFPGGACNEAQIGDREHDCIENGFISLIKWTIHENLIAGTSHAVAMGPH